VKEQDMDKEINDFVEEMEEDKNPQAGLPEAASSITITANIEGYSALVTLRSPRPEMLLTNADLLLSEMKERGYTPNQSRPTQQSSTQAPTTNGEKHCPKCGGKVLNKTSKAGKRFEVCENNKFGSSDGCDYFRWLDQ
jgi:putative hemolysin